MFRSSALRDMSLTARLAVALHCFEAFCNKMEMVNPEIDALLDHLWEFPLVDRDHWDEWDGSHPALVEVGLGEPWPSGFEEMLIKRGIDPVQFRTLLGNLVEIIFHNFYVASDDNRSLRFLLDVITIVGRAGVRLHSLDVLMGSLFADRGGWGQRISRDERDHWRVAKVCKD